MHHGFSLMMMPIESIRAKMPHCWKFLVPVQMSLLVCVDAVQKKLNFDLLTQSPGSGGRRGG